MEHIATDADAAAAVAAVALPHKFKLVAICLSNKQQRFKLGKLLEYQLLHTFIFITKKFAVYLCIFLLFMLAVAGIHAVIFGNHNFVCVSTSIAFDNDKFRKKNLRTPVCYRLIYCVDYILPARTFRFFLSFHAIFESSAERDGIFDGQKKLPKCHFDKRVRERERKKPKRNYHSLLFSVSLLSALLGRLLSIHYL